VGGTCPECGAVYQEETSCQEIYENFLVLEFTDPGYGAVHFLTVACFMVQHGRYSDAGMAWIEQKLRAHLEEGVPVEQIRWQASAEADQSKRGWKVTRSADDAPLPKIAWSMTIADVAGNYRDAGEYQEKIRQWARVTRKEMRPYLPGHIGS
jgi:hypothetical protein